MNVLYRDKPFLKIQYFNRLTIQSLGYVTGGLVQSLFPNFHGANWETGKEVQDAHQK